MADTQPQHADYEREIRYRLGEFQVRFVKPGRQSWWSRLQGWRRNAVSREVLVPQAENLSALPADAPVVMLGRLDMAGREGGTGLWADGTDAQNVIRQGVAHAPQYGASTAQTVGGQMRHNDGFEGGVAQQRARGIAPGDVGLESHPHPEHNDGADDLNPPADVEGHDDIA